MFKREVEWILPAGVFTQTRVGLSRSQSGLLNVTKKLTKARKMWWPPTGPKLCSKEVRAKITPPQDTFRKYYFTKHCWKIHFHEILLSTLIKCLNKGHIVKSLGSFPRSVQLVWECENARDATASKNGVKPFRFTDLEAGCIPWLTTIIISHVNNMA